MTTFQKSSLKLAVAGLVIFIAPLIWLLDLSIRFNMPASDEVFLMLFFVVSCGGLFMVIDGVTGYINGPIIPRYEQSYYHRSNSSSYDDD